MTSLFLNTSSKRLIVAIIENGNIIAKEESTTTQELSKNLMVVIDDIFVKSGKTVKDLDTIFVTNGPGSFTGIRIGLTVAKVLAWSLKIKVIPISSLELMASGVNKPFVASLMDARRDYVYAGLYDDNLNQVIEDKYISLSSFMESVKDKDVVFVSDDDYDFASNPGYDILKVIEKHKDDSGVNPHLLNPNYLKKTEAEENLNRM